MIHCIGLYTGKEYTIGEWAEGIKECTLRFPDYVGRHERNDILNHRREQCSTCYGCPEKIKAKTGVKDNVY